MNDVYLHLNDGDEWEMRKVKEQEILAGDIVLTRIQELEAEIAAWRARDAGAEDMLRHCQKLVEVAEAILAAMTDKAKYEFKRAEAAEARAAWLASCLSNLGQDAHMGDCWAALHDFVSGFECDCGVSTALSISDVQINETEHPLKTAARLSRPKSK